MFWAKLAQILLRMSPAAYFPIVTLVKTSGVNFTNILWAAFAPKSFRQKITNPNCKHIKVHKEFGMKKLLIKYWWNDSHTNVLCTASKCLQFGFVIFWRKDFGTKAAHKMLVKLTPGGITYLQKTSCAVKVYFTTIKNRLQQLIEPMHLAYLTDFYWVISKQGRTVSYVVI